MHRSPQKQNLVSAMDQKIHTDETFKCSKLHAIIKVDELESAKQEMTEVREENKRLKNLLRQVEKDYMSLQKQFPDISQNEDSGKSRSSILTVDGRSDLDCGDDRDRELVSLSLGTNSAAKVSKKENVNVSGRPTCEKDGTEIGLGYSSESSKTDDRPTSPDKVSGPETSRDEEVCLRSVKRARVCVRARCDTPTMNDGCQWRKYGQKIAKGNPCPRAYYRCTVSSSCPVRKQVQRCMADRSILITTYEGTHDHPLPISAATMASTTSAAASMLLSGPTTSPPLNPYTPPPPPPVAWPTPSAAPLHSTITLDLTANPAATCGSFSLLSPPSQQNPKFLATSLSFSHLEPSMGSTAWGASSGFSFNSFQNSDTMPGKSAQEQKYFSCMENLSHLSTQQALTDTLTRVISSDPSFRSVLAAMVSTMAAAKRGDAGK